MTAFLFTACLLLGVSVLPALAAGSEAAENPGADATDLGRTSQ